MKRRLSGLNLNIPVIAVLGRKKTGKTLLAESLIRTLVREGYRVASGKHVAKKGFSIDREGSDSWRHRMAGASKVVIASERENSLLSFERLISLQDLLRYAEGCDVMVLEGFSNLVAGDPRVGKILCFKEVEEKHDFNLTPPIIGFYSLLEDKGNSRLNALMEDALEYVRRERGVLSKLSSLPGLNCGKCGYSSCWKFAEALWKGETTRERCKAGKSVKLSLKVGDVDIPLQPFVAEIIRKSVLGMVSTLKKVSVNGNENVSIEVGGFKHPH
ncbi:MAG: molybdopterin-guanine dinucleotide biosynthesis protein B [Candidatus Brockarchaeota archaeon]|nr:molybdopterin-guanine dinucleotide biosynthesis protein B [Candidatus Brockarchaeota archaeon]